MSHIIETMQPQDLQKTADQQRDFPYPLKGNFKFENYTKYYQFHMYEPSPDLAPFVAYYSVFRPTMPDGYTLKFTQVLQIPNTSLFFSPKESSVLGIMTKQIHHQAQNTDIKIRVIFKAGGLYAFRPHSMAELVDRTMPITWLFPEADEGFVQSLLTQQAGEQIVSRVEALLRTKTLQPDENIALINAIISALDSNDELTTVGAVAQKFHKSERSLQHLFYTYVGVGIKWIMIRSRVLKAVQHAQAPKDINWTQIAADLGYSTQSHLVNEFKKLVGGSPSQFQNQQPTSD